MVFDIKLLSKDIKNKRLIEDKGLRTVAKEIGVSAASICRIENGQVPDIKTFGLLCTWLIGEPNRYFKKVNHIEGFNLDAYPNTKPKEKYYTKSK